MVLEVQRTRIICFSEALWSLCYRQDFLAVAEDCFCTLHLRESFNFNDVPI